MEHVEENIQDAYRITSCAGNDLLSNELIECVRILEEGSAVNPRVAEKELPLAPLIVIVRKGHQIVGVGAIKQSRAKYASSIAKKSGHPFHNTTCELGYVAVDKQNRGCHLSGKIVDELLSRREGQLFATTDTDRMKSSLRRTGFKKEGLEWKGKRGLLSLWIRR